MECTIEDFTNFVEEHGWIQGSYSNHGGGYCLMGAMFAFCPQNWPHLNNIIVSKIRELGFIYSTMEWNDAPGRTKEEVLEMLRS